AAFEAVAVCALLQARESVVHPAEGFRLHLDKSELDVFLDIGFRTLTRIENLGELCDLAGGSDVAHLALHLGLEFPTTAQKHLLELVIPAAAGRCGCAALSVFHDAAPCLRAALGPRSSINARPLCK